MARPLSPAEQQQLIALHKEWRALAARASKAKGLADKVRDDLVEALIHQKGISPDVRKALTFVAVDSRCYPDKYTRRACK